MTFSSLEIELVYLKAVADYTKHKIGLAKSNNEPTDELEKKLKYYESLAEQFQTRLNATH